MFKVLERMDVLGGNLYSASPNQKGGPDVVAMGLRQMWCTRPHRVILHIYRQKATSTTCTHFAAKNMRPQLQRQGLYDQGGCTPRHVSSPRSSFVGLRLSTTCCGLSALYPRHVGIECLLLL